MLMGWKDHSQHNAKCISEELQNRGITVDRMADDLGINIGLLTHIVAGQFVPGEAIAKRIAEYLNLSYTGGRLTKAH